MHAKKGPQTNLIFKISHDFRPVKIRLYTFLRGATVNKYYYAMSFALDTL